jgi:hypothetical protein
VAAHQRDHQDLTGHRPAEVVIFASGGWLEGERAPGSDAATSKITKFDRVNAVSGACQKRVRGVSGRAPMVVA